MISQLQLRLFPRYRADNFWVSIVTIRSIWHNSAADFSFAFWKISAANLRILWRHLLTELSSRNDADCHTMESHLSRWTNTDSRRCCVCLHKVTIFKVVKTLLAMKPSDFTAAAPSFPEIISCRQFLGKNTYAPAHAPSSAITMSGLSQNIALNSAKARDASLQNVSAQYVRNT